jgi:integrase
MGRKSKCSVELREASIRLAFQLDGARYKKTLFLNGKPLAPTPANEKYARRVAAEIDDKLRLGAFVMAEYFPAEALLDSGGGQLLVRHQLETWLKAQRIEDSTKSGYESAIRMWKDAPLEDPRSGLPIKFGDIPLRGLKLSHVKLALATRPHLTGKTVNNYVSVLREALGMAVEDGALSANPADGIKRAKHQKEPPDPFSLEEAEAICAYAQKQYPEPIWNLIETWFFTGPRTSEIQGLKWPTIDLRRGEAVIREALVRGKEKDKPRPPPFARCA